MSHVTCHMSHVKCHLSHVTFFFIFFFYPPTLHFENMIRSTQGSILQSQYFYWTIFMKWYLIYLARLETFWCLRIVSSWGAPRPPAKQLIIYSTFNTASHVCWLLNSPIVVGLLSSANEDNSSNWVMFLFLLVQLAGAREGWVQIFVTIYCLTVESDKYLHPYMEAIRKKAHLFWTLSKRGGGNWNPKVLRWFCFPLLWPSFGH